VPMPGAPGLHPVGTAFTWMSRRDAVGAASAATRPREICRHVAGCRGLGGIGGKKDLTLRYPSWGFGTLLSRLAESPNTSS